MPLSLKESQAISKLADHLYSFLPGKAHPFANQAVSFEDVASEQSLGRFWPGGSKLPAINQLFSGTLQSERGRFCALIVEIVRRGMIYRQSKGSPITREEVELLNELIAEVGFKIPELHDLSFLNGLPRTPRPEAPSQPSVPVEQLDKLQKQLITLTTLPPTQRGLDFERFLGELFEVYELAPRTAFRLTGEQIDGSLQFQGETYLVEAKWQDKRIGQEELLTFSGKVSGKAKWSRGLFISMSGFTDDGLEAFSRGKPTIICIDGLDLYQVLQGRLDLRAVCERKVRRAAETNQAFVAVRELFSDVI